MENVSVAWEKTEFMWKFDLKNWFDGKLEIHSLIYYNILYANNTLVMCSMVELHETQYLNIPIFSFQIENYNHNLWE